MYFTNFTNSEKKIIENTLATIRDNFKYILAGDIEAFKTEIAKSSTRNEK
ncbi:MAG UNVERIFIED_CONTAM: hypothetical protein LVQ98_06845 [Rickettsiaceae bacterium]